MYVNPRCPVLATHSLIFVCDFITQSWRGGYVQKLHILNAGCVLKVHILGAGCVKKLHILKAGCVKKLHILKAGCVKKLHILKAGCVLKVHTLKQHILSLSSVEICDEPFQHYIISY